MHLEPEARVPLLLPGILLGVALGGFFDGIVLHQILQWHHLLSDVDAIKDIRLQLLADGAFHALMYLIAVIGLVRLWKVRRFLDRESSTACLCGAILIGFGTWHLLDAVLSHWLLG
ncbi:MAG: DUF2243 domain-containing protein, partial [Burkholderiales bacterium]